MEYIQTIIKRDKRLFSFAVKCGLVNRGNYFEAVVDNYDSDMQMLWRYGLIK